MSKNMFHRIIAFCLFLMIVSTLLPATARAEFVKTGYQAEDIVAYAKSRIGKKDENSKMCAGFVCSAAKAAGLSTEQINLKATLASPWKGTNQFGFLDEKGNTKYGCSAYTWKDFKDGNYQPRKGDLVFYGYIKGSSEGTASLTIKELANKDYYHVHVGIIRSDDCTTTKLYTIDGGQKGADGKNTWVDKKNRTIKAGSGKAWSNNGRNIFVMEFIRPNYKEPSYLDECMSYVSYVDLVTKKSTTMKTFPCSAETDQTSQNVITIPSEAELIGTKLWKNSRSNYWYEATYTSSGETYKGYVFAGDCTATPKYDVSVSGVAAPEGARTVGKSMKLKGKVASTVLPLSKVGAFVYSGQNTSGDAVTGSWASTSKKSFEINGTKADSNCKIGSLSKGTYTYTIKAQVTNNWTTDGTTLQTETKTLPLYSSEFTEK